MAESRSTPRSAGRGPGHDVTRYTHMPRGGHFAAHEEPGLPARDIIEFFRAHRPAAPSAPRRDA